MPNGLEIFNLKNIDKLFNSILNAYQKNGIVQLQKFISEHQITKILSELKIAEISAQIELKEHWKNQKLIFYSKNPNLTAEVKMDYVTHPYFKSSHNKSHLFYEDIVGTSRINRIGHGLHLDKKNKHIVALIYENPELNLLLKLFGMQRPICHLSVYIPKFPNGLGSEVNPHQESTFAHTSPLTATVLWIALEDAVIENACMWGILESHQLPLHFISRVDHATNTRQFEKINSSYIPVFDINQNIYTPLQIKAGDALFFHGNFIHCSPINNSKFSRKALSFQFIDSLGCQYSSTNWIETPNTHYMY